MPLVAMTHAKANRIEANPEIAMAREIPIALSLTWMSPLGHG